LGQHDRLAGKLTAQPNVPFDRQRFTRISAGSYFRANRTPIALK
jgi:hypothetical protein